MIARACQEFGFAIPVTELLAAASKEFTPASSKTTADVFELRLFFTATLRTFATGFVHVPSH